MTIIRQTPVGPGWVKMKQEKVDELAGKEMRGGLHAGF